MNASCTCITLGLVANVVAACIELDSTEVTQCKIMLQFCEYVEQKLQS